MYQILILMTIQTAFLSVGQVLLKLAMNALPSFSWSMNYLKSMLTNWWLLGSGASFGIAIFMWLYILKHFPLSQVYPLTAISYIFGVIAAKVILGETVPLIRWIGVILIVIGCILIMK